ncbi:MAG: thioredoxin family protein [Desulfobacterales bacterium]|jgi:thioredoxin-related protein
MKFKTANLIVLALFFSVFTFTGASASSSKSNRIEWHSYEDGMARGKFEKKAVFLYFTAEWCYYCGVMEKETFQDPAIISSLNDNFVSIKVDYDRETGTSNFYRVRGLPDTVFVAEDGQIIGRRPGYIPPELLKRILESILNARSQE